MACPAVGLAGWSFGQLPTLCATTFFLFAVSQGDRFVRRAHRPALVRALAWAGAAAAAHHATLLFALFAGAAVMPNALMVSGSVPNGKMQRSKGAKITLAPLRLRAFGLDHRARLILRAAAWAALSGLVVVIVLWPFLKWSAGYLPQTPIDHASRHSFFSDPAVTFTFFWPAYAGLLLLFPWVAVAGARLRRRRALAALFALFFVLGLGGTTPLPARLFGANWQWLTYDRFALWAAICLLPFAGAFAVRHRRVLLSPLRPGGPVLPRLHSRLLVIGVWLLVIGSALYGALLSVITHAEPRALNVTAAAEFLAEGANDQWRYLTLGFGDQAARLATLTTAGTIDGAYHTAR